MYVRFLAGLIAAGLLVGALPAPARTPSNTLVVAQALDEMVSIDPAQAYEVPSDELITNVYDQLFTFNSNSSEPQPDVVTAWKRSDDGLTYSFEIRQGMKFHSGNPLTVDDVIFSLQRALKLNFAPANDLGSIGVLASNIAVSLQKTGPYSFSLKANKPYAPSLYLAGLGLIVGSVVDQKLVMEHEVNGDLGNTWLKTHSAGSGPFRLRNWTPLDSYVLERVPGHWRGDAPMQTILVRGVPESATQRLLLERGDVDVARDLAPGDVAALATNPAVRIDKQLKGRLIYLAFNQKNTDLAKPEVRQALKYLIDYQGMVNTLLHDQYVVQQKVLSQSGGPSPFGL
jgi:peptide/nickel transport system substrate-binding protein